MLSNWFERKAWGLTAIAAVVLAVALIPWRSWEQPSPPPEPVQTGTDAPAHCKMGLYIVDLHDLDIRKKVFDADFWLWSLCADAARTPLKTAEFVNANRTASSLDQAQQRDGVLWSAKKVEGTFRHDWNVRDYPFDRHTFRIAIEEGQDDTRHFLYEPDRSASGIDHGIHLPGWTVKNFRLVSTTRPYRTTFGDPALAPGTHVDYSRLEAEVTVARESLTGFLKMTSAVYVAATLALLSFLFQIDSGSIFSSRISFLAGALFATVVNMRVSSSELGSEDGLTLMDGIHITVLLLVIAATICTVLSNRRRRKTDIDADSVRAFDRRNMAWCAGIFLLANVTLIAGAILIERV